MLSAMLGGLFIGVLMVGPILWRVWLDRREERALAVRAHAHAVVLRALGGESLVAVNVEPSLPWRPGRIVLSAPSDWRGVLERAASAVVRRVPADYELVVKPASCEPAHVRHAEVARAA